MSKMTLRSKLIIGGVVAAMLPLVVVGLFSINKASTALVHIADGQAKLTAQSLATMVNLYMEQEIEKARTMASAPLIQKMINNAGAKDFENSLSQVSAVESYLSDVYQIVRKNYDNILVTDSSGLVLAEGNDNQSRQKRISLGQRTYFQSARSGKITIGEPVISKFSGEAVFVVAVPLRDSSGAFTGILGTVVKLTTLSEKITQMKMGETGYPFMVGNDGLFLAHPVEEYIFKLNVSNLKGMEARANAFKRY